ncbi:endonuclease/exonuclease/phosphatase family protein [Nesterenkonia sp. HG001]|uniref:endonuclease/exonuclease/phosphatase family protein n=1 Tax=Nesterenkonia sp. HG001 TaxID=2983207 RepID=UPI002AC7476D|nr:endonuclease/exonuclease/phosphatase family protein [Nesterenkonia sp. HG001]MDZ5078693.1 endonuclease/exonuclease/phosphatase family protein [Nesterenkonia sp. HG001]
MTADEHHEHDETDLEETMTSPTSPATPTALTAETDRPALRLFCWNLWFGGEKVNLGRHKQVDVLRGQQIDLLFLQECWGDAGGRLGRTLGMAVAQQSWDNAVLAAGGVRLLSTDTAPYATAAIAQTRVGEVLAWSVHLAPQDYGPYRSAELPEGQDAVFAQEGELTRDQQAQQVLAETDRILAEHGDMPVIIAGDFNVPSPVDWEGTDRPAADWPATRRLIDAGYTDAFRAVHPDPVRTPGRSWSQIHTLTDEPRDRIDFIYVRGLDVLAADHLGGAADGEDAPDDQGFVEYGGVCRHIPDHEDNEFPSDHLAVRAVVAAG